MLARRPSALLTDVDGTISPIQPSPELSFVPEATLRALERLIARVDLVAAVSGRSANDVRTLVGLDQLVYVGNHGLELWQDGRVTLDQEVGAYLDAVASVTSRLVTELTAEGTFVEPKGITTSVHYRLADDHEAARQAILAAIAAIPESGQLRVTEGRMVVNLVPPVERHKGSAVRALARAHHLQGILFIGDDTTDMDAFAALRDLRAEGVATLAVAVASPESPPGLLEGADYQVSGVDGVERLLEALST